LVAEILSLLVAPLRLLVMLLVLLKPRPPLSFALLLIHWKSCEAQCDDLECPDLLHAGRTGYRYGFAALNLRLGARANDDPVFDQFSQGQGTR